MLPVLALLFHSLRVRPSAALLGIVFATLSRGPLAAQSADAEAFHWGFGSAFGRGTYQLADGSEVQIYRMQFKPRLRETPTEEGRGPGVRLVLPFAVGLHDTPADPLALDQPNDRIEQYAFMPGVELEFAPGERFTLRTTMQGGWGSELEGAEQSAKLASFNVRSRVKFVDTLGRPALSAGLQWAGLDPSEGERRALMRFTTGLEFDISVPNWQVRGHSMRLLPHVLEDRFYRPPPALAFGETPDDGERSEIASERQVGLAIGRTEPFKILFIKFDAVGIAYRFSDQSKGIRLYLNSVF
jgi:hypothetical protein